MHAEKALDTRVKGICREYVGHERHLIVKENMVEKVEKDKHLWVIGDHREFVESNVYRKINGDKFERVEGKRMYTSMGELYLASNAKLVIESATQVSIKCSGSFIDIGPSGVTIQGPLVKINSGGAPANASSFSGEYPDEPQEADSAEPGQRAALPSREAAPSPQAQALQQASQSGSPFCDT